MEGAVSSYFWVRCVCPFTFFFYFPHTSLPLSTTYGGGETRRREKSVFTPVALLVHGTRHLVINNCVLVKINDAPHLTAKNVLIIKNSHLLWQVDNKKLGCVQYLWGSSYMCGGSLISQNNDTRIKTCLAMINNCWHPIAHTMYGPSDHMSWNVMNIIIVWIRH
jgi:hypothetical protein